MCLNTFHSFWSRFWDTPPTFDLYHSCPTALTHFWLLLLVSDRLYPYTSSTIRFYLFSITFTHFHPFMTTPTHFRLLLLAFNYLYQPSEPALSRLDPDQYIPVYHNIVPACVPVIINFVNILSVIYFMTFRQHQHINYLFHGRQLRRLNSDRHIPVHYEPVTAWGCAGHKQFC